MGRNSNPAGSEGYEVNVDRGCRPDHDRVFGFQRTAQPDCAKGGSLRRGSVGETRPLWLFRTGLENIATAR